MVEAQRALLDELMGTARNLTAEERKAHREIRWDDKEVCGCFLVKFCPHELFVNTKSDLGPCPKIHDPKLKESYQQSTRHDLYISRFEAELFQFCEKLVQDLDRKVRRGREWLAQDIDASSLIPISTEKSDQLVNIEESIKKFLEEIETFGEEGKVDDAEALMKKNFMLGTRCEIVELRELFPKMSPHGSKFNCLEKCYPKPQQSHANVVVPGHEKDAWPELLHAKFKDALLTLKKDGLVENVFVQLPSSGMPPANRGTATDVWLYVDGDGGALYEIPKRGVWHPNRLSPGWPDLAGKDYKSAISKITQDYLGVTVIYGPKGYMRIQDFRLDRVWLDVNPNGTVAGVPTIG